MLKTNENLLVFDCFKNKILEVKQLGFKTWSF